MVYTIHIPALCNIHGICMIYTIHIPCKIFIRVPLVSTPWMYGSRGAQCKAGVIYALFSRTRRSNNVVLEKRFKNRQWGQNRWILKLQTYGIAKLKSVEFHIRRVADTKSCC